MNYILFDGPERNHLLPLTFTRPIADIRIGITTIYEKWVFFLQNSCNVYSLVSNSLLNPNTNNGPSLWINASILPNKALVEQILQLSTQEVLVDNEVIIAYHSSEYNVSDFSDFKKINFSQSFIHIQRPFHIFQYNDIVLKSDFENITKNRESEPIPEGVQVINPNQIFIEKEAEILFATLNASTGPIYIGKNTQIQEGVHIRGSLALCEGAQINMGARIFGATTIGPMSKIGGEVNNSVIFGFSSKGHEGFMGNSVIGEWCNWGADTNNSNLKNNYSEVQLWNYVTESYEKTGLQFCGVIMGDHAKTAINTQLNTGTVVGTYANVFQAGFPAKFIPDFTWGENETYQMHQAAIVAERVMERRNKTFTQEDKRVLENIFTLTQPLRNK